MKNLRFVVVLLMISFISLFSNVSSSSAQKIQDRLPATGKDNTSPGKTYTSSPSTESGLPRSEKADRWRKDNDGNENSSPSSRKQDRYPTNPNASTQPDNVRRTASGYGYGGNVSTPKIQDRLPADKDYRGPITEYRTINPETSMRQLFGNQDYFFEYRSPSPYGHYYNGFYSLGLWQGTEEQAMTMIKGNMRSFHPMGVDPLNGQDLKIYAGNRFSLSVNGYENNPVKVMSEDGKSFTLLAEPGHTFQGTAKFEVFKDSSGELWLHVEGRGVDLEHRMLQRVNSGFANGLWPFAARNAREILSGQR